MTSVVVLVRLVAVRQKEAVAERRGRRIGDGEVGGRVRILLVEGGTSGSTHSVSALKSSSRGLGSYPDSKPVTKVG